VGSLSVGGVAYLPGGPFFFKCGKAGEQSRAGGPAL